MVEAVVKRIDKLGRIVIPAAWRKNLGDIVLLIKEKNNTLKIVPLKDFKLTDLFDSIETSVKVEDWGDVRKLKKGLIDEISGL